MKEFIFDEENNEMKSDDVVVENSTTVDDAFAKAEKAKANEQLRGQYAFLGKWIWYLFILIVPSIVAGILSAFNESPMALLVGDILDVACDVAYIVILIILGKADDNYKKAGYFQILSVVVSLIGTIVWAGVEMPLWYSAIQLVAGLVGVYGMYLEFKAHSEVVAPLDATMSEQWSKLFKLFAIATIGSLCSALLILIPVLGLLCLLGFLIMLIVVSIMKIIYLYRTSKIFKDASF